MQHQPNVGAEAGAADLAASGSFPIVEVGHSHLPAARPVGHPEISIEPTLDSSNKPETEPEVHARLASNARAAEIVSQFWGEKRARAEAEPVESIRASRLSKIDQQETWFKAFLERNSTALLFGHDCERIFTACAWYAQSERPKRGDFSGLQLFGVDTTKIESIWGAISELSAFFVTKSGITKHQEIWLEHDRREGLVTNAWTNFSAEFANALDKSALPAVVTKFFREFSFVEADLGNETRENLLLAQALIDAAEERLAGRLKADRSEVPLSYHTLRELRGLQALMPDSKAVVKLNEALLAPGGANLFLFCCPDYAREKLAGGNYRYTMDGLGIGTGLTGERALPVLNSLMSRLQRLSSHGHGVQPVNVRIGFADFEATPENAANCGMGPNPHEFLRRLGLSTHAIRQAIQNGLTDELRLIEIEDSASLEDPVGRIEMQIVNSDNGNVLATVSVGRVTETFKAFNSEYDGIHTFEEMVRQERQDLVRFATADLSSFTEGKERSTAEGFRRALDTLLALRLELMLEWRTERVPAYIDTLASQMPFENKAEVIRSLQQGMASGDPEKTEALRYLRGKIAAQGAEYATMHKLMHAAPNVVHMYADAANMWQLFGKKSIPMLGVRGGYAGADVVDLTPAS